MGHERREDGDTRVEEPGAWDDGESGRNGEGATSLAGEVLWV